MTPLAPNGMVIGLISQVEALMGHFGQGGYNALAAALKAPLAALIGLYIVLLGYGITHGFIKSPLPELYKLAFRLGLVYFFVMSWGNFSFYVVGLFDKGMGELASAIMKASHVPYAGNTLGQALQSSLNEVFKVGWATVKMTSLKNWWPYYTGLFIWLSGMAVVAVALFEIVVAKVMMSVCFAVAPLFLILVLFDKTRPFFDRWLGSLAGFSLLLFFVSILVGLCMTLIHASVALLLNDASQINQLSFAPIFLVACLTIPCLFAAAGLAKHIGGACHTAGGGAMVGGLIGASMGMAMSLHQMNNVWRDIRGKNDHNNNEGLMSIDEDAQLSNRGEV